MESLSPLLPRALVPCLPLKVFGKARFRLGDKIKSVTFAFRKRNAVMKR